MSSTSDIGFDQIIDRSAALREALTRAAQDARTEATRLISGESVTGKELVARAIHYASPRADGPFVVVNCATREEAEAFIKGDPFQRNGVYESVAVRAFKQVFPQK